MMIKTFNLSVSFSNMFLQRNFIDGIAYKANSMAEFLRTRLHEDEEKAEKMVAADLTDTQEFERLATRIGENEAGLLEVRDLLETVKQAYAEISDGQLPPSLLPKEKKVASRESRQALLDKLAARKQA